MRNTFLPGYRRITCEKKLFAGPHLLFFIFSVIFFGGNIKAQTVMDSTAVKARLRGLLDTLNIDPRISEKGATEMLEISKRINYHFGEMVSLETIGTAKQRMGQGKDAMKYHEDALAICRQNKFTTREVSILSNYSRDYRSTGNYQKAFEIQLEALKICRVQNDSMQTATVLGDIGQTLYWMKYYDNAVKYIAEAGDVFKMMGQVRNVGVAYNGITAIYLEQNKYDSAFKYARLCVDVFEKMGSDSKATPYMNLGICYDKTGQRDSALVYYSKSLKISEEQQDDVNTQLNLYNIATLLSEQEKPAEAEVYYKKAFELGNKTSNLEMVHNAGRDLSVLYAKRGDYKNAYDYMLKSSVANDSLLNDEKVQALAELNVKFETQQLELKNAELAKKIEAQKFALFRSRVIMFVGLLVAIIVIIVAIFLIRQNRLKSKLLGMDLEQKQYRAQMNPHFIFNSMNSIQHYIVHNDIIAANRYLSEFAMLMRRTLEMNAGHTVSLKDEISYLENYLLLERMRFDEKFTYEISCANDIDRVSTKILPMVLQPFIENSIQHGLRPVNDGSGKLTVGFEKKDGMLVCTVDDNGIGRDAARELKRRSGVTHVSQGMSLIEKRLDLINKVYKLNFKMDITDKFDADKKAVGTTVTIRFLLV
ncbi:MAG: tetratricopeptide repeat protein [Ferruginibacter sp.]